MREGSGVATESAAQERPSPICLVFLFMGKLAVAVSFAVLCAWARAGSARMTAPPHCLEHRMEQRAVSPSHVYSALSVCFMMCRCEVCSAFHPPCRSRD